jgi:hypothetical protein
VIKEHHLVDVFIGDDVGKSNHHAVALDRTARNCWTRHDPRTRQLRGIIPRLSARAGHAPHR